MVVFGAAVGGHVWLDVPTDADRVSSASSTLRADRTAALADTVSFASSLGLFYATAFALTHDFGSGKTLGGQFELIPALAAAIAAGVLGHVLFGVCGTLAYGPAGIVVGGLVFPHASSPGRAIAAGVAFGIAVGLTVCLARAWGAFAITRLWHVARSNLPLRLMAFLDDAHRRGVLRQVGAVYQFRHARLRNRLVYQDS